ncbi:MAG: sporulation integral membrane protein YtvI [Clostridia bacterium]|nr:sporulation integral membrane protein YtvI [Clostridia bacterium]
MENKQRTVKILKRVAIFVGTLVLLYLLYKFATYFMPFLIAGIIAILIEPVIKFCMNKLKLSRRVSSILVVGITIILIALGVVFGSIALADEAIKLTSNIGPYVANVITDIQDFVSTIGERYPDIPEEVIQAAETSIISFVNSIREVIVSWATNVLKWVFSVPRLITTVVITILALIFFAKDRIYVIDMMEYHFPKAWIKKISEVTKETFTTIGGYIRVYGKIIIITFVELYIAFTICRLIGFNINYPFLLAVLIAIVDILPILGVGTVLIPWAIWLFATGQVAFGFAILITHIVIFVIRQFIEPKLVSKQFGIHPLITLFAMYAGFKAAGVFGLILGPVTLMVLKCIFAKQLDRGLFKDLFDEK